MSKLHKFRLLANLAMTQPYEAFNRIPAFVEVLVDRYVATPESSLKAASLEECLAGVANILGEQPDQILLDDPELKRVEVDIVRKTEMLLSEHPFSLTLNGGFALGQLCYAACRLLKPKLVVETGTAYGVTTSFLLLALHQNRDSGRLISIDLPPLGRNADRFIGYFIPEKLRTYWTLVRGTTKQRLPAVLRQFGAVDLFVHDSLHTYKTMKREFETAFSHLSNPGIIISDDIDGNTAFSEFVKRRQPRYYNVIREPSKGRLAGITVL